MLQLPAEGKGESKMNQVIRVSPSGEITALDLPDCGSYERFFRDALGGGTVTAVYPKRLYSEWHNTAWPESEADCRSVCMLADMDDRWSGHPRYNLLASWLFETEIHSIPITGPVLFVGQKIVDGRRVFCGIDDFVGLALLSNAITATTTMRQILNKRRMAHESVTHGRLAYRPVQRADGRRKKPSF